MSDFDTRKVFIGVLHGLECLALALFKLLTHLFFLGDLLLALLAALQPCQVVVNISFVCQPLALELRKARRLFALLLDGGGALLASYLSQSLLF